MPGDAGHAHPPWSLTRPPEHNGPRGRDEEAGSRRGQGASPGVTPPCRAGTDLGHWSPGPAALPAAHTRPPNSLTRRPGQGDPPAAEAAPPCPGGSRPRARRLLYLSASAPHKLVSAARQPQTIRNPRAWLYPNETICRCRHLNFLSLSRVTKYLTSLRPLKTCKCRAPGWLGGLGVRLVILAPVMISGL